MINFFRKIRQRLLTENKFSKYLLYAIGEIALVMIGILLALQVNNWNEETKNNKAEIKILQHLVEDLTETKEEIVRINIKLLLQLGSISNLVNYIENDVPIDNSNLGVINTPVSGIFNSTNTTINFIESEGMGILRNDSIRTIISNIYERFGNIHKRENLTESRFYHRIVSFKNKYFEVKTKDLSALVGTAVDSTRWSKVLPSTVIKVVDSIGLKKDMTFLNTLHDLRSFYQFRQLYLDRTANQIDDVRSKVSNEISRMQ